MAFSTRELERVARDLSRQRCDPVYIRHYLIDEFQCDPQTVDRVLEKVGITGYDAFTGERKEAKRRR